MMPIRFPVQGSTASFILRHRTNKKFFVQALDFPPTVPHDLKNKNKNKTEKAPERSGAFFFGEGVCNPFHKPSALKKGLQPLSPYGPWRSTISADGA
jgi:hypothetical protein